MYALIRSDAYDTMAQSFDAMGKTELAVLSRELSGQMKRMGDQIISIADPIRNKEQEFQRLYFIDAAANFKIKETPNRAEPSGI
jgi:hypothetical protein